MQLQACRLTDNISFFKKIDYFVELCDLAWLLQPNHYCIIWLLQQLLGVQKVLDSACVCGLTQTIFSLYIEHLMCLQMQKGSLDLGQKHILYWCLVSKSYILILLHFIYLIFGVCKPIYTQRNRNCFTLLKFRLKITRFNTRSATNQVGV